jgi:hypothetical protein
MPLIRGRDLEQFSESNSRPYRGVASAARTSKLVCERRSVRRGPTDANPANLARNP